MGQIQKVAEATHRAMSDAGLTNPRDVHLVMVKVPGLTVASIRDAESRGETVVSHDLTFGPEGAGSYANDAAALGVALARLARDPALRARLGAAGRGRVAARYTTANMANGTLACYDGRP